MSDNKTTTELFDSNLLEIRLQNSESFIFDLEYNRKKFLRNGFLLLIGCSLVGGLTGVILDALFAFTGISKFFDFYLFGSGIGAIIGLILGLALFLSLRSKTIIGFGASYGVGIGANIFIGGVTGALLGLIGGPIYAVILNTQNIDLSITINLYLFGVLIWIAIGFNIGLIVGLFSSVSYSGIVFFGAAIGAITGTLSTLVIVGIDVPVFYGTLIGLALGGFSGVLLNYSISYSLNIPFKLDFRSYGTATSITRDAAIATHYTKNYTPTAQPITVSSDTSDDETQRGSDYDDYAVPFSCGFSDCSTSFEGDCAAFIIGAILLGIVAAFIVVVAFIILLTKIILKLTEIMTERMGSTVKRGALSLLGLSFSTFLLIGVNIGLTESIYNLPLIYNLPIGFGIGLLFASLFFIAISISFKSAKLVITPKVIRWTDRNSTGLVYFKDIVSYEFNIKKIKSKTGSYNYDDSINFSTKNQKRYKVLLNGWYTPIERNSAVYIKYILSHYLNLQDQFKEELTEEELLNEFDSEVSQKSKSSYTFSVKLDTITDTMVQEVSDNLNLVKRATVSWLTARTNYSKAIIRQIVTVHLGYEIVDDDIVK
ncbi:MAG: hypothetical protein FK734_13715 [Asgard group archaeon]|nr:hypothetical protein [Asgard group archaeon]